MKCYYVDPSADMYKPAFQGEMLCGLPWAWMPVSRSLQKLSEISLLGLDELVADVAVLPTSANGANSARGIADALRQSAPFAYRGRSRIRITSRGWRHADLRTQAPSTIRFPQPRRSKNVVKSVSGSY